MMRWLASHWRGMGSAIRRLVRNPLSTLTSVIVIGATVSLPLVGIVAVRALDRVIGEATGHPVLNVFMALDAGRADLARVESLAKSAAGVSGVRYVSKEAALDRLKGVEGLGEAIATLRANPLPDAFVIELEVGRASDGDRVAAILKKTDRVAYVQWDDALHRRADTVLGIGRILLAAFGGLLGVALIAVTFNTVRLQIFGAVEEVALSRLVGATDTYIRRPFCYYGLLLGSIGGAAGLGLAAIVIKVLWEQVSQLALEFGTGFKLDGLIIRDMGATILLAGALGLLGAYLSVSAHLRTTLRPE